jgi:peptidoglycan/xylan/chitin deacetylase (PgdA/CDA1 family)
MISEKPSVTIVVPAYNEEDMISTCLQSILAQDYSGTFDVIVVNNASTDATKQIALDMGVRVVDEFHRGYVYAMRAGFSAATGDIIACTDADTLVPSNWLAKIANNLSKKGAVACSGVFSFHDGSPVIRTIGKLFGCLNYHLAGANMAVWRSAYLASGGFDVHVNMGADVDLGQRLKKQGRVSIDRSLVAQTSGRRFQYAFWQTVLRYYINDFFLLVLKRPLFYDFPKIRAKTAEVALGSSRLAFGRLTIAGLFIALFLWITEHTDNHLFGSVLAHGQHDKPLVALTFDDGPSMFTAQVLDTLKKYNVKATFFVIGSNVDKYPDLAKRIVTDGHAIGNHTYTHPFWAPMEIPDRLKRELDKTAVAIHNATGIWPEYFRPPHGWRSPWMMQLVKKNKYTVVTWTVSPDDWQHISAKTIEDRVLSKTGSGGIVLMHDGIELKQNPQRQETVNALPAMIAGLRQRGYQFVTLPELIHDSSKQVQTIAINSPPAK